MKFTKQICSFTGYRYKKLYESLGPFDLIDLKARIREETEELIDNNFTIFQCGMALGADTIFAEVILEFSRKYPRVKLIAAIPCLGQDKSWNEKQQEKYNLLLKQASEVKLINDAPYFDGCMQIRNKYLADTCDLLLAVYDGKRGGTMQTVEYAKKCNKTIRIIDPSTMMRVTLIEQGRLD